MVTGLLPLEGITAAKEVLRAHRKLDGLRGLLRLGPPGRQDIQEDVGLTEAGSTVLITPTSGRPRLQVFPEDQRDALILRVLEVLEHIGVQVDNDEAVELLSGADAQVGLKHRVFIPSHLVKESPAAAPPGITVYHRLGEPVIHLTENSFHSRFAVALKPKQIGRTPQ